ncbi:MAG: TlpA family protein disulfide reductase [candidate division Zixibacteria bacterium]|nr:TlpA family protein disulfide reductase [candidate division Zixibacteria bacterium]MDH3936989.1 TlpA family protein disulfide reductase [candidate division Zixibacteria bacterium]MDH4033384.1 TlpA family protein disulfide reductase [candidate division Zixibacteria bacterium]
MIKTTLTVSFVLMVFLLVSCSGSNEAKQTNTANNQAKKQTARSGPKDPPPILAKHADQKTTTTPVATESKPPVVQFAAYDIKGKLHNSDEWIGKQPTVINVWGTWCPPCRREIPDLVLLNAEFEKKGVALLGLAVRDTPQKVEKYAAQNKMSWPMMMGENQHLYTLGVTTGVPTTIFYNREGKEVQRFVGPRNYATFKQAFEAIL